VVWRSSLALVFTFSAVSFVAGTSKADEPPLHVRIDALIERDFTGKIAAEQADDSELIRRVWLDLAGRPPTPEIVKKFLADSSADKRQKAIDDLLAAPTYVARMQDAFHVLLMERRGEHKAWQEFLKKSFEDNVPWDVMVRAMLDPEPAEDVQKGATFFLTKRLENYGQNPIDHPGLTRDIGRLFLGIDLQCAQCHNHLFVDEYKQAEFQGLYAVVQSLSVGKADPPQVAEKPLPKKLEFVSVFDPTQQAVGPRVPFGKEFEVPAELPKDKSYSPLKLIAQELPRGENPLFARNIAYRMRHLLFGRGLVEPLDVHHRANPPTHPELLELLSQEMVAHKFNLKYFLRELALTKAYQRSSLLPKSDQELPRDKYLFALPKRLSAEQFTACLVQATCAPADVEATTTALKPKVLAALANPAREPEDHRNPSVQSALFTLNDAEVLALIARKPGNLLDRLMTAADETQRADELCLTVLARLPIDEERAELRTLLEGKDDRREALLGHWIWALVASTEFGVNH